MFDINDAATLDFSNARVRNDVANAYVELAQQIEALEAKQKVLREAIIKSGFDRIAGDFKDVTVHLSQRKVLDADKLERLYKITVEQLKAFNDCKKDGADFPVVKVVEKK